MANHGVVVNAALAIVTRGQHLFAFDAFVQRGLVGKEHLFVNAHLACTAE